MSNDKDLDAYLDSIGMPRAPSHNNNNSTDYNRSNGGEIDVGQMLQQRIMQRMTQGQQHTNIPNAQARVNPSDEVDFYQPQTNKEMVYLREGQQYFMKVPAEMSPVPIAMLAGPLSNTVGKEYVLKGSTKYYVVENHSKPVDLSNPDYSKMKVLYAIDVPWSGTILVPESALIRKNQGRQMLKG